jgi:hypothetical protein
MHWDTIPLLYPLAPTEVQKRFLPDFDPQYADQDHCVHKLEPDIYIRADEDGPQGSGIAVFQHGDWTLQNAIWIKAKHGFSYRIKQAIAQLKE